MPTSIALPSSPNLHHVPLSRPTSSDMGLNKDAVLADVIAIVANQLAGVKARPNEHFVQDLSAEPIEVVRIVGALQEKFGMEFSEEDALKIISVETAVDVIMAQ